MQLRLTKRADIFPILGVLLLTGWLFAVRQAAGLDPNQPLVWATVKSDAALCNDHTKAGFFHREPSAGAEGKWVIYLESGAVCYSNETCNRRYFNSTIQKEESRERYANGGYGDFDTVAAFKKYAKTNFVNPLMTSLQCFNNTSFFPDGLKIQGRDLFDSSLGHSLARHGHVLIPYCSSDVWLGTEGEREADTRGPCGCQDYECSGYTPDASGLQFTFRGKTIFQNVLRDLVELYGLHDSVKELILVGSSAGGVGAINLAQWVIEEFPGATVKVIADSAWFVNFRDGIYEQFSRLKPADIADSTQDVTESPSEGSTPAMSGPSSHVTTSTTNVVLSSPSASSFSITHSASIATPSHTVELPSPSTIAPSPTPSLEASGSGSGWLSGDNSVFDEDEEVMRRYAPMEFEANQYAEERDRRYATGDIRKDDLFLLLKSHDACSDNRQGYPCCLSASCVLSSSNPRTNQPYFPGNVSLFIVTSLYDVFILSRAIQEVQVFREDADSTPVGLAVEYLTLVGEYGGLMHQSLTTVQDSGRTAVTVYVSQCFQHIYFAMSTLWGEGELLGTEPVKISAEIGAFR